MHVGGVSIFDAGGRPFDLDAVRQLLEGRLHLVRSFRERLVEVPLGLGRPHWVDDPGFALDVHLHHVALPRPAGWRELVRLVSREQARPLDRSRPLWELTFVEGLDSVPGVPPGGFAVLSKVHHAAIDGVSGSEILGALLDVEPGGRSLSEPPAWNPGPMPGALEVLTRAAGGAATHPVELARFVARGLLSLASAGSRLALDAAPAPPAPFRAPLTPFNVPVSARRSFGGTLLALDRLRAVRDAVPGATVNDVVLALVSGALREHLLEIGELPARSLVAMAPVSVREESEKGQLGNRISALLARLHTEEPDPLERLRRIHAGTQRSKVVHRAVGARTLADATQVVPFSLAGLAVRLYTGLQASRLHDPIFNLIVTNVPGPQQPLYLGGSRLLAHFGTAPLFDGLGLIVVVLSYAGTLSFGITACHDLLPDADGFAQRIADALAELEAALRPARRRPAARRPAARKRRAS
jgi:WS/DGAT/MGAT family acyltransferase